MKWISILILVLCFQSLFAQKQDCQNIKCNENVLVRYKDIAACKKINSILYVELLHGFSDTIEIYINDKLISYGFYKTDDSVGKVLNTLTFKVKKNKPLIIKLRSIEKARCMEILLDKRFQIINIDFSGEKWTISYSNIFVNYE